MTPSDELRSLGARLRELAAHPPAPDEIDHEWPAVLHMTRECVEKVADDLEATPEQPAPVRGGSHQMTEEGDGDE